MILERNRTHKDKNGWSTSYSNYEKIHNITRSTNSTYNSQITKKYKTPEEDIDSK